MALGYIGSKKSLLSFLDEHISKHIKITNDTIFADVFAGTGAVGNHFNKKYKCNVIANDMEYYSYIINYAKLNTSFTKKLGNIISKINYHNYPIITDDVISTAYTKYGEDDRMFFTIDNGCFIDYTSCVLEYLKSNNTIDYQEYIFLKASLLTSLDKRANTSSVYGAYLKKFKNSAIKTIILEPVHTDENVDTNVVFNNDVLELSIEADVGYLDPPYNNRQYGNNYSQLNYIMNYNKSIELKGKTGLIKNWNKSLFCYKKTISNSIISLLSYNKFKVMAFSYNNEGLLNEEELTNIFKLFYDTVTLYKKEYKKFKANKNVKESSTYEYLFICE